MRPFVEQGRYPFPLETMGRAVPLVQVSVYILVVHAQDIIDRLLLTYATLQEDPNIREFWGHSIERMWSGLFDAPGGLGGAIWGYVDETFMLPEPKVGTAFWKEFARTAKPEDYQGKCVGYGEWGIVDVWRREKPEFWATKKAYSPVRLMTTEVASFLSGQRLLLPLYNRFDHTDLDEIKIRLPTKVWRRNFPLLPSLLTKKDCW